MTTYSLYAGGKFKTSNNKFGIKEKFKGKEFAYSFFADDAILEESINKAIAVKEKMQGLPSHAKYAILMEISRKLLEQKKQLAGILAQEAGKPMKFAISEIQRAAQTFIAAAEESKRLPSEHLSIDWTVAGEDKEAWVKYFPLGLVAGIAPFNFPMNLAVHKIAPAIASGCPIILKPATSAPLSTLELAKIIDETALPKGAVSIFPMNRETGNKLVTDERFNLLTFTGSPEVGWQMKSDAGKKKVVLELGGNAATIITETADMDFAVKKSIIGGFAHSGQVCIHAQRFYVHHSVFEEFIQQIIIKTKQLKRGNPLDMDTDVSVMIDESNAKRVDTWVQEAIGDGAKLLTGGKREGNYFEPTILTNTNNAMKVCSHEVFGPVITIEPYKDFEEAVNKVNNTRYGLQAGVFTNKINEMNLAFKQIQTGGVIINDVPTFRVDHMPYGGIKDSGYGREGVKYAIHDMMEPKVMVKNM